MLLSQVCFSLTRIICLNYYYHELYRTIKNKARTFIYAFLQNNTPLLHALNKPKNS